MKILVIGDGELTYQLARMLAKEGHLVDGFGIEHAKAALQVDTYGIIMVGPEIELSEAKEMAGKLLMMVEDGPPPKICAFTEDIDGFDPGVKYRSTTIDVVFDRAGFTVIAFREACAWLATRRR